MRLWVRPGVQIKHAFSFSRAVEGAPDTSEDKVLYPLNNPSSRQSVFRVTHGKKEQKTLSKTPSCVAKFAYVTIHYPHPGWGILTPFPFKASSKAYIYRITLPLRID